MFCPPFINCCFFLSPRNLGVAVGIAISGTGFGQIISAPLFQNAVEIYGLSNALAILASTFSLCIVSGWFISQEDEKPFKHLISRDCKDVNSFIQTYKEIFTTPQLILLVGYTSKRNIKQFLLDN